jgi:uncharacterized protein (TIGR02646 family)
VKHIVKDIKNEPLSLRDYRNATPNARYDGYTDKSSSGQSDLTPPLKTALAQEQGYICCYCMRRISEKQLSVEHYISQSHHSSSPLTPEEHRQNDLNFLNMLASCNLKDRNCSGIRGNLWITVDPRKKECESLVKIERSGKVSSSNPIIQKEIEQVLQLNTTMLIENRRSVIVKAMERLQKIKKTGFFTDQQIQNEINFWLETSRGQYREYCLAAVHYLQSKMQKAQ